MKDVFPKSLHQNMGVPYTWQNTVYSFGQIALPICSSLSSSVKHYLVNSVEASSQDVVKHTMEKRKPLQQMLLGEVESYVKERN